MEFSNEQPTPQLAHASCPILPTGNRSHRWGASMGNGDSTMITPEQMGLRVARTLIGCYFVFLAIVLVVIFIIMMFIIPGAWNWTPLDAL